MKRITQLQYHRLLLSRGLFLGIWLGIWLITPGVSLLLSQPAATASSSAQPSPPALTLEARLKFGAEQLKAGNFEAALTAFEAVLRATNNPQPQTQSPSRELHEKALKGLILSHQQLGNHPQALHYLRQLHQWAIRFEDSNHAAKALATQGNLYQAQGDYVRARGSYAQAAELYEALGDRFHQGRIATNRGNIQLQLGQYHSALALYQKGLRLAHSTQDILGSITALNSIGSVEANAGRYAQARTAYQDSLQRLDTAPLNQTARQRQRSQATLQYNLGALSHAQQDFETAQQHYQTGLAFAESLGDAALESSLLSGIGLVYEQQGNAEQAFDYLQRSVARLRSAETTQAKAMQLPLSLALGNLGYVHWRAGRLTEAEAVLQEAIALRESIRRRARSQGESPGNQRPGYALETDLDQVSLFDRQIHAYPLLQQVLVALDRPEEALAIAERGRNRAFIELLNQRSNNGPHAYPTSGKLSLKGIQQLARQTNSTLVEYSVIPDETFIAQGKQQGDAKAIFIWVIQPNGTIHFRNIDLALLKQQNLSLSQAVQLSRCFESAMVCRRRLDRHQPTQAHDAQGKDWQPLRGFYQLLIEPISDLFPADPDATITLIPHDVLFLLPFPALQTSNQQFLLQQHTLAMAPSLQSLMLLENKARSSQGSTATQAFAPEGLPGPLSTQDILLVGNPTMPTVRAPRQLPRQLSSLPGTEIEIEAIAQFLPQAQRLTGDAATEAAITPKLSQARWIHLATHGLLEYSGAGPKGRSIPGAIALAPGPSKIPRSPGVPNPQDGLLTANEIIALKLRAELVVLSACDTGRGNITGDGVIGLSRAWLGAGAENILVSLWAVPDDSTALLMSEFYRNLSLGQSKAQALRQAMLITQSFEEDPRHWAAFQLVGRG